MIEAQIDEMAGDKAAAEAKYRRAVALDPSGLRTTHGGRRGPAPARARPTMRAQLLKTYRREVQRRRGRWTG